MKNGFLLIVIFIIIGSCETNHLETLNEDPNVHEIFNRKEISGLNKILEFFDSIIMNNTKEQNVTQAYYEYFEYINTLESFEELRNNIGLANSDSLKALINVLKDKKVFNEIWEYSYHIDYKSNDTLSVRLSLNLQGKYFQMLELLEENNDFIKLYSNYIRSSGYINPTAVASVMKQYMDINFQSPVKRLIWAVHYITILSNEPYVKNYGSKLLQTKGVTENFQE